MKRFDTSKHDKFSFTPVQKENLKEMDSLIFADIKDRVGLPVRKIQFP